MCNHLGIFKCQSIPSTLLSYLAVADAVSQHYVRWGLIRNYMKLEICRWYYYSITGSLLDRFWGIIPQGRRAFAPVGEIYVMHGGLSLDEMVVPLAKISLADRPS